MRDVRRRLEAAEAELRQGPGGGGPCEECHGRRRVIDAGQPVPVCERCGRQFDVTMVTEFLVYAAGDGEPELPTDGRAVFAIPDNGRDGLPADDMA